MQLSQQATDTSASICKVVRYQAWIRPWCLSDFHLGDSGHGIRRFRQCDVLRRDTRGQLKAPRETKQLVGDTRSDPRRKVIRGSRRESGLGVEEWDGGLGTLDRSGYLVVCRESCCLLCHQLAGGTPHFQSWGPLLVACLGFRWIRSNPLLPALYIFHNEK